MNERVVEVFSRARESGSLVRDILLIPHNVSRRIGEDGGIIERMISYGSEGVLIGTPLVIAATAIAESGNLLVGVAWGSAAWGIVIFGTALTTTS